MTFADLAVGDKFRDSYINMRYVKIEPLPFTGKRLSCSYCGTPAATLFNARCEDGALVHLCATEPVVVAPVQVEA